MKGNKIYNKNLPSCESQVNNKLFLLQAYQLFLYNQAFIMMIQVTNERFFHYQLQIMMSYIKNSHQNNVEQ